ncbi:STT3 domain-containing protein [Campylobacter sp. US33a]|uniref:STT3 domain-containing protein n=1 Tax=Campylobacter sp. US33a TaxID=2498120 RepID=UPI00106874A4|nr:STT3 domain-containing protein [Campylobacter sp. US33a]TEY04548.1 peptide-binding protein [Campylobacter sp. US33a]
MFKKENFKNYHLFLFIILAYSFSVLCRFYWVWWASDFDEFYFNHQLMIMSNDGYVFAEGARDMLAGFHQPNDLSYYGSSLSTLTYYIYKFTPFSFETIILYMSTFFSSLIVIPIILIANEYKQPLMGLIAATLASIANSYYNRTMSGYYDTDMLVIVLPMFVLFFIIRLVIHKDLLSLILLPITMIFYLWWYPSSYTLNCAFMGLFLIYTYVFHRKDNIAYLAIIFMMIALAPFAWFYQLALLALIFALFAFKNEWFKIRLIAILGALTLILLIFSGGLDPIIYQLQFYIFKNDAIGSLAQNFVYFNVNETIQEVGDIDWTVFMQRISTNELTFIVAFIGLIWLLREHKSMILALPMLALGFLALKGGLRFTIYAVPIMALGYGYIGVKILNFIQNIELKKEEKIRKYQLFSLILFALCSVVYLVLNLFYTTYFNSLLLAFILLFCFMVAIMEFLIQKKQKQVKIATLSFLFSLGLVFGLKHIYEYKAPSVFIQSETEILNRLKGIADREDYVVAWWDYGYPIRYYSDVKTLVDGGKHLGKDNFFPSFVLSKDQISAANMARLSVEYTEKGFYAPQNDILRNDLLRAMMKDYNASNVDLFLYDLRDKNYNISTPKTRDVYIYMPARMMNIFSTVATFSNIDLSTGEVNPFIFRVTRAVLQNNGEFILSDGSKLSEDFRIWRNDENNTYAVKEIIEINSVTTGDYKVTPMDTQGKVYVFFLKEQFQTAQGQFIIMDEKMFNSAFVQMFFFNNYDKDLYDLIINDKNAKVFKIKK